MSDYTPTTKQVRERYAERAELDNICEADGLAQFDRWLVEHDRQVAEEAWDEGFAHSVRTNFHSRMPRLEDNPFRKEAPNG